ncbi:hypothetical protein BO94DRAFT_61657 [Aspergillus sclerotioniger CBS 115572]|uniref:Uncharacterized protein n=1 Tax=Aspergillus sclerotioniger CBS 115572 TaxID=1450535 RepID=A0A317WQQ8_9EURO|nr:hypothetical protein BO94DRAFT_61657 [Aspergillus sclerotioniger CBS 115572]PWY88031.1 hypothetical protein BO94DRAFT_61657 [Aspergillus sclerotioniger CBS 115572]
MILGRNVYRFTRVNNRNRGVHISLGFSMIATGNHIAHVADHSGLGAVASTRPPLLGTSDETEAADAATLEQLARFLVISANETDGRLAENGSIVNKVAVWLRRRRGTIVVLTGHPLSSTAERSGERFRAGAGADRRGICPEQLGLVAGAPASFLVGRGRIVWRTRSVPDHPREVEYQFGSRRAIKILSI